jgi:hypothetical protein
LSRLCSSKSISSRLQVVSHDSKPYANDGVFSGVSPVLTDTAGSTLSVGIIASSWPGWAYPFSHLAFSIKWILLVSDGVTVFDAVTRQFPHIRVMQYSCARRPFGIGDEVDIMAFNGPCVGLSVAPTFGHIALFDWKFRNRGNWDGWTFRHDKISHAQCGGTSDYATFVTLGFHSDLEPAFAHVRRLVTSSFPACNLSTVTKCTITGKELKGDPHLPVVTLPPTTTALGPNVFHFKGLFPASATSPEFILPCVFGRKSKWVRRRLSLEEFRDVQDVPVSGMRKRSLQQLLPLVTTPIKILSAVVNDLFLRLTGGGGCSCRGYCAEYCHN